MTPALAAIIVNYNAGDELARCLDALAAGLAGSDWEAVVVDNASTDGSPAAADRFAPRVTVERNADNTGFARAVNQGLALTSAPLVLVINPDCRLVDGAIATLRAALEADPACALVGPRVLDPDGTVQGSARGDPTVLTGLFGRSTLLTRWFPRSTLARRNVPTAAAIESGQRSVIVDWVSGACFLARRAALETVGGFDERFFLYWEDADLCRRLRARRYRIKYVPGATVVHRVGQSSRMAEALAVRSFHESAYLYYRTHVARPLWHPARWMARLVLSARCWWRLYRLTQRPSSEGNSEQARLDRVGRTP